MNLDYIKGVNLGNWLVLEKWMNPALFDGTTADDEYYLPTQLDPAVYEARIRTHRAEYINERDFATIKSWGLNSVRIPVPYFIFGDRAPFIGCIDELDKAFNWAEKYGLTILIDLHTAPMSQNGFDNGGISGVCKWAQLPDEVEFVLSVLERLARRYGHRRALMGIEIINEPNTTTCWPMANVTERYKAVDPELAEGTGPIAFDWLKNFYITAYHRLRDADKGALPTDKVVVFHDGFDIEQWKDFMRGPDGKLAPEFKNVVLDTHQYLMTAETMGCPQTAEGYDDFVRNTYAPMIAEMSEYFPVIVGEWCLFNSVGCGVDTHGGQSVLNGEEGAQVETLTAEQKRSLYQGVAESQLAAWSKGSGFYYWNYKLLTDTVNTPGWIGWDAWDLGRCIAQDWFPIQKQPSLSPSPAPTSIPPPSPMNTASMANSPAPWSASPSPMPRCMRRLPTSTSSTTRRTRRSRSTDPAHPATIIPKPQSGRGPIPTGRVADCGTHTMGQGTLRSLVHWAEIGVWFGLFGF